MSGSKKEEPGIVVNLGSTETVGKSVSETSILDAIQRMNGDVNTRLDNLVTETRKDVAAVKADVATVKEGTEKLNFRMNELGKAFAEVARDLGRDESAAKFGVAQEPAKDGEKAEEKKFSHKEWSNKAIRYKHVEIGGAMVAGVFVGTFIASRLLKRKVFVFDGTNPAPVLTDAAGMKFIIDVKDDELLESLPSSMIDKIKKR